MKLLALSRGSNRYPVLAEHANENIGLSGRDAARIRGRLLESVSTRLR